MQRENLKELFEKYKDLFPYAVFGILSTITNIIVYWLFAHPLRFPILISTVVAWFFAVMFAYLTNRKWVFHSKAERKKDVIKEIASFFICRIGTEFVDIAFMFFFADLLNFNDVIIKTVANIFVIILNYAACKFIIFKKPQTHKRK